MILSPKELKVVTVKVSRFIFNPKSSQYKPIRSFISAAPVFVNVNKQIFAGSTPSESKNAVLNATHIVFPAPAPAFTRANPLRNPMTFSCASVNEMLSRLF